jgi:hypothetical protein
LSGQLDLAAFTYLFRVYLYPNVDNSQLAIVNFTEDEYRKIIHLQAAQQ